MLAHRPIIAVDFDGTLATHAFPKIGRELAFGMSWLRSWKQADVHLILFTVRGGTHLTAAVEWCLERGVTFDAINDNLPEVKQADSTGLLMEGGSSHGAQWSVKPYYNLLIDDRNAGAPLDREGSVDWFQVGPWVHQWLVAHGVDFHRDAG